MSATASETVSPVPDRRYPYRIRYRDDTPGSPDFSQIVRAFDTADAEERFYDCDDTEGWAILKIERVLDADGESKRAHRARHGR